MRGLLAALALLFTHSASAGLLLTGQAPPPPPPPGPIQIVQGLIYGVAAQCASSWSFTLPASVKPGDAIMGAFKWEAPSACNGGGPDVVTLGSQAATELPTIWPNDFGYGFCCPQVTPFVLFNASGGQTLTISSSNGGNFLSPIGLVTEISGLGNASVDVTGKNYTKPAGSGNDALTSGAITPAAGDFLYGFQVGTYTNNSAYPGTGWTAGPNNGSADSSGIHNQSDEVIFNASGAPIAATFGMGSGGGEVGIGIIAIKHQ